MNQRRHQVSDPRPTACRLIIDPPASGVWNMAVDEALFLDAAESGGATLRFYQWSEPTLSLGYFQRYEDRHQHAASRNCPIVRRQTGGGAILHDRELTYSLSLPAGHLLAKQTPKLYTTVHDAFIAVIESALPSDQLHWTLLRREEAPQRAAAAESFLCFQRQAKGDVLLVTDNNNAKASTVFHSETAQRPGSKILGSAQRRHRGAVLQHGSLLLERSPAAPELPGLRDLTGITADLRQLTDALSVRLATALDSPFSDSLPPPTLQSRADELANTKYGCRGWTNRR